MGAKDDINTVTGKGRLSFPKLFTPEPNDQGQLKYSVLFMFPKSDTATLEKLRKAEQAAALPENDKNKVYNGKLPAKYNSIITDGDGVNQNGEKYTEKYPERAGHWFLSVSANEDYPPQVVDRQLNPITDRGEIYAGVVARLSLRAYAYDYKGKKGVSFGLKNVQKLEDAEAFAGGRSKAEDDFDAFDDDLI